MAAERIPQVAINPVRLTIHNRGTLLMTDRAGKIDRGVSGLYAQDTRYLSRYCITINQVEPRLLSSIRSTYFAVTHTFTNPLIGTPIEGVPAGSLLLRL